MSSVNKIKKFFGFFFLGSIKSKIQKQISINYSDQLDNVTETRTTDETTTTTDEASNQTVLLYCIVDSLFSKKPTFNEFHKTLRIYAEHDIIIKPREFKVIHTNDKIYFSEYLYNYGTISNKYSGSFLIVQFNFLNEGNLNQSLKVTLKNLSCYTYKIPKDEEIGTITFVTNKKVQFQLVTTYQIIFDPLTKAILRNDDRKDTRESKLI